MLAVLIVRCSSHVCLLLYRANSFAKFLLTILLFIKSYIPYGSSVCCVEDHIGQKSDTIGFYQKWLPIVCHKKAPLDKKKFMKLGIFRNELSSPFSQYNRVQSILHFHGTLLICLLHVVHKLHILLLHGRCMSESV